MIEINKALEKGYEVGQIFNSFARLQIATIELEQSKGDDPQMIFERINATGLHLKGLDLIRNFLMMELKPDEQVRIFKDYWAKIEKKFSDEKIIQKFITVYLRIYKGANVKDDEIEIYKSFKDLRKDTFDDDSEKILKDMIKFARIYKIIIDKKYRNELWQYENEIRKEKEILCEKIDVIHYLDFGTAYPFVMRLIDDFENTKLDFKNLSEILDLLISFFVRRSICALPTASLNKMLYPLYNRLKKDDGEISANAVARYFGQKSGNEVFPNSAMLKRNFESTALFKSKKLFLWCFTR